MTLPRLRAGLLRCKCPQHLHDRHQVANETICHHVWQTIRPHQIRTRAKQACHCQLCAKPVDNASRQAALDKSFSKAHVPHHDGGRHGAVLLHERSELDFEESGTSSGGDRPAKRLRVRIGGQAGVGHATSALHHGVGGTPHCGGLTPVRSLQSLCQKRLRDPVAGKEPGPVQKVRGQNTKS